MSLTESDVNVIKSMFVDEIGKAMKGLEDRTGARFVALETSMKSQFAEVNGALGQVLDRLTVVEGDISAMRAQLAGLARVDVQRRLDKLEARLAALEEARQ